MIQIQNGFPKINAKKKYKFKLLDSVIVCVLGMKKFHIIVLKLFRRAFLQFECSYKILFNKGKRSSK